MTISDGGSRDPYVRSITVIGEGAVRVKPDTAQLNLGVQVVAPTATESLTRANTSAAALIDAVKTAGISEDDISTAGLSIYPQYGSHDNSITGYQASNNVTVTVRDVGATGSLIDLAARAAGDDITIGGVSFSVHDAETVMGAARAAAIENARKRAAEYAAAGGVTVGSVVQINEVSIGNPSPMLRTQKFAAASSAPIETGMQDLTVSVTVVFELE
jgi:uncharacterized protein YggE